jgi:hypothetical protein
VRDRRGGCLRTAAGATSPDSAMFRWAGPRLWNARVALMLFGWARLLAVPPAPSALPQRSLRPPSFHDSRLTHVGQVPEPNVQVGGWELEGRGRGRSQENPRGSWGTTLQPRAAANGRTLALARREPARLFLALPPAAAAMLTHLPGRSPSRCRRRCRRCRARRLQHQQPRDLQGGLPGAPRVRRAAAGAGTRLLQLNAVPNQRSERAAHHNPSHREAHSWHHARPTHAASPPSCACSSCEPPPASLPTPSPNPALSSGLDVPGPCHLHARRLRADAAAGDVRGPRAPPPCRAAAAGGRGRRRRRRAGHAGRAARGGGAAGAVRGEGGWDGAGEGGRGAAGEATGPRPGEPQTSKQASRLPAARQGTPAAACVVCGR